MKRIHRALISIFNKEGVVDFARGLQQRGVAIIASAGTAALLKMKGVQVKTIEEITKFPPILDGRVKTLHPLLYGGILALRGKASHQKEIATHGIPLIDLVVVNLYPFAEAARSKEVDFDEAMEYMDIGGEALIRAATKNFVQTTVVVKPEDYSLILEKLDQHDGCIDFPTRLVLARKAMRFVAEYNLIIANFLERVEVKEEKISVIPSPPLFPAMSYPAFTRIQELRYGENPHQKASLYRQLNADHPFLTEAKQLQGKSLSFNNLLDFEAARRLCLEFEEPVAVIIKHNSPCGVAVADTPVEAYRRARECDPISAFGSIICFNRKVDETTAREVTSTFVEGVLAPAFDEAALKVFSQKSNLRVLLLPLAPSPAAHLCEFKHIDGGLLLQQRDVTPLDSDQLRVVTKRSPTPPEMEALRFAWKVVKHVKSNAIVFSTLSQTVGIGGGQTSRVDAVRVAIMKAKLPLKGTVVASDAFFPFRDNVDLIAEAEATAIIQPGGSIRDKEVIEAADQHNLAMVFTGIRHFRH
ncbi:MAG: bifunctional phosphoribosylaminoimidazolecarboxamide formyltransferase/IMP cyclohydrolase [Candidatus Aminicenantes bacterium]|nr:bifunctional phosphoribosylaminoimidazolecarboxamide formyltransferase/IMP cyclohydrolase [Candidatus Aminicenantes bacterium]